MRIRFIILLLLSIAFSQVKAQVRVTPFRQSAAVMEEGKLFTPLELDKSTAQSLLDQKPAQLQLALVFDYSHTKILRLKKVERLPADARLELSGGEHLSWPDHVDYTGTVEGETEASFVVLTITTGTIRALITIGDKEYTLAPRYDRDGSDQYALGEKHRYPTSLSPISCQLSTENIHFPNIDHPANTASTIAHCVRIQFEIDDELNRLWGGPGASVSKLLFLFNAVSAIYARESITLKLAAVKVWNTPAPYYHPGTSSGTLSSFYSEGTALQANIAHLLHAHNREGGYAALPGDRAVEGLNTEIEESPYYSFDIYITAHELGHNIGSPHTHDCGWTGGALDNCAPTQGGCAPGPAPVNGGTIMSYCHLVSAGVNFNNGFGPQPGNLLRQSVAENPIFTSCDGQPVCTDTLITGLSLSGNGSRWRLKWTSPGLPVLVEQKDSSDDYAVLTTLGAATDSLLLPYPNLCAPFTKMLRLTPLCPSGNAVPLELTLPAYNAVYLHPSITQNGAELVAQPAGSASQLQWYLDGQPIPGAMGNRYKLASPGIYTVKESTASCFAFSNELSIGASSTGISINPNPVHAICTIAMGTGTEALRLLQLFDGQGRLVQAWQGNGQRLIILSLQNLVAGSYFLRITTDRAIINHKLVKD